jgi:hypothetical protein
MFFRLSKNSIKNAVFDPFEGGYPPPPSHSLYIASAYDFIEKSLIFIKKTFKPLLSFSFGLGGLHVEVFPVEH